MSLHATRCNFCFIHFMTISLPTCSACSVLFLVYWSLCSSVPHLHYIISSWAFSQLPYWLLLPSNASLPLLLQTCSICLCWFGDALYYSRCLIFLLFLFLQWWINHPTSRCTCKYHNGCLHSLFFILYLVLRWVFRNMIGCIHLSRFDRRYPILSCLHMSCTVYSRFSNMHEFLTPIVRSYSMLISVVGTSTELW